MRTEILQEAEGIEGIAALYGMGSFFRGAADYSDIDLVAVVDCPHGELLAKGAEIRKLFGALQARLGVILDLTILTPREFAERPFRDIDEFETLFLKGTRT